MNYLQVYGMNGVSVVMPLPIRAKSAPTVNDKNAVPGQQWIDELTGIVYSFGGTINGSAIWSNQAIRLAADAGTSANVAFTANYSEFVVAITNLNTAVDASGAITISNNYVSTTSSAFIGATISGAQASGFNAFRLDPSDGLLTILYTNSGTEDFDGTNTLFLAIKIVN